MDGATMHQARDFGPNGMWSASAASSFRAVSYSTDWALSHALGKHHATRSDHVAGEFF